MIADMDPKLWLDISERIGLASCHLVCFPHAGGSAGFFRSWAGRLEHIQVSTVSYPGRAERITEPSETNLVRLARHAAHAITSLGDRPIALFGHSMGAVVALEAAFELQRRGLTPLAIFASGSRNASAVQASQDAGLVEDDDDDKLMDQLVRFGGTAADLASDPDFRELVLPYVRSDGRMFHTYQPDFQERLACPIAAIVGDEDDCADCRPWVNLTSGPFTEFAVPGDHFYLAAAPPFGIIERVCREALAQQTIVQ